MEDLMSQEETNEYIKKLSELNIEDYECKRDLISIIDNLGMDAMEELKRSNARTTGRNSIAGRDTDIKALKLLAEKMRELDPRDIDFRKGGIHSLFNLSGKYFERYRNVDTEVSDIVKELDKESRVLRMDNTTLDIDIDNIKKLTARIEKCLDQGKVMEEQISKLLTIKKGEYDSNSENAFKEQEKINFIEQDILDRLRRRLLEIRQIETVNQQEIAALLLLKNNNSTIIGTIENSINVSLRAIRMAAIVSKATDNKELTLNKINSLNVGTKRLLKNTIENAQTQDVYIIDSTAKEIIDEDGDMSSPENIEIFKSKFADALKVLEKNTK